MTQQMFYGNVVPIYGTLKTRIVESEICASGLERTWIASDLTKGFADCLQND